MKREELYEGARQGQSPYSPHGPATPSVEHRDRRYANYAPGARPSLTDTYGREQLSDQEITALLEVTQQQLMQQRADPRVQEEFTASCWQLCGLSCAPDDHACVQ